MGRWYLAGRMTGLKEENYPAFNRAATKLRAEGLEVINPAALCMSLDNPTHARCMERCAPYLIHRDTVGVIVLSEPDAHAWTASTGASWEVFTALLLGKQAIDYETRQPIADRYLYDAPCFVPHRGAVVAANASTAMVGAYSMIARDLRDGVAAGVEQCGESGQQRQAG